MGQPVGADVTMPVKHLPTLLAREDLVLGVDPSVVRGVVAHVLEALPALVAHDGLWGGLGLGVRLKVGFELLEAGEVDLALTASVRRLRMPPLVSGQHFRPAEPLPAPVADVLLLPGVDHLVDLQMFRHEEGASAELAREGLHSGVDFFVIPQQVLVEKHLPALVAREPLRLGVPSVLVGSQLAPRRQGLAALVAPESNVLVVDFVVRLELRGPLEGFPAFAADVPAFGRVGKVVLF